MANQQIDNIEDINEAINPITPPIDGQEGLEMLGHNRNQSVILSRFSRSFFKIYSHLITLYSSIKSLGQNKLDKGNYIGTGQQLKNEIDGKLGKTIIIKDANFDMLSILEPGLYASQSSGISLTWLNRPSGSVGGFNLIIQRELGNRQKIIAIDEFGNVFSNTQRSNEGSLVWQGWRKIYDSINKPTKIDVGLENVDNTSDSTKSVRSATRLTTGRTIGGVLFDGTLNIDLPGVNKEGTQNSPSATKLKTARSITIGNKSYTFDGTTNLSYTLADIGAVSNKGDTIKGTITIDHVGESGIILNSPTGTANYYLGRINGENKFLFGNSTRGSGDVSIYNYSYGYGIYLQSKGIVSDKEYYVNGARVYNENYKPDKINPTSFNYSASYSASQNGVFGAEASGGGCPVGYGASLSAIINSGRGFQIAGSYETGRLYHRGCHSGTPGGWGTWWEYLSVQENNLRKVQTGTTALPSLSNEGTYRINFPVAFSKAPVVTIGGSVGRPAGGGNAEGGIVTGVTNTGFTFQSSWENGGNFTLSWIAVETY